MARIELVPDHVLGSLWWLKWVETDEIIGRLRQDLRGRCLIAPQGPHWSPMKSFAGRRFETKAEALAEVRLYFSGR